MLQERRKRPTRLQRLFRVLYRFAQVIGAVMVYVHRALAADLVQLVVHVRLFLGSAMVVIALVSFSSDRYCEGNSSSYYACTQPSTYYYYPWWATVLLVLGTILILLWVLRKTRT